MLPVLRQFFSLPTLYYCRPFIMHNRLTLQSDFFPCLLYSSWSEIGQRIIKMKMACGKFTRHKRENVAVFVSCTRWLSVWKTFEDVDECLLTDFLMDANVALIFCFHNRILLIKEFSKNETPDIPEFPVVKNVLEFYSNQ